MRKIAFIFPGQASQYVGMGRDIYENSLIAKKYFDMANDILKFDIRSICFNGPEVELKQTKTTQPSIFIHSYILSNLVDFIKPDMVAGHSLGEYSAIASSDALGFEEGLNLVALRGELMQKAGEINRGTMAAVVGLVPDKIKEICKKAEEFGVIQPANFNSLDQIVISGSVSAVHKAMEIAKDSGAKIVKELVVSGAFHSELMEPAKEELSKSLKKVKFNKPSCPIYSNATARPSIEPEEISKNLELQLTSPVLWFDIIKNMINDGAETFIEIGPGKVLQGLVKRISPKVRILGIDKFDDLEKVKKEIG